MSCRLKTWGIIDVTRGVKREKDSRVGVSNFERCPFSYWNPRLAMETRLMDVLKKGFSPFYNGSGSRYTTHVLGMFNFKSNGDSRERGLEIWEERFRNGEEFYLHHCQDILWPLLMLTRIFILWIYKFEAFWVRRVVWFAANLPVWRR